MNQGMHVTELNVLRLLRTCKTCKYSKKGVHELSPAPFSAFAHSHQFFWNVQVWFVWTFSTLPHSTNNPDAQRPDFRRDCRPFPVVAR